MTHAPPLLRLARTCLTGGLSLLAGACGATWVWSSEPASAPAPAPTPAPAPDRTRRAAPAPATHLLLVKREVLSQALWTEARALGAQPAWYVNGHVIDPDKTGRVDVELMARWIRRNIPANATGFAVLDIEVPYFQFLQEGPGHPHFQQAQEQMLLALRAAKQVRPQIKWTYYGLPYLPYWLADDRGRTHAYEWASAPESIKSRSRQRARAPAQLLAELDWLSPSLYDPHPADPARPEVEASNRACMRARTALAVGLARGRPVVPHVTHRYHPSHKTHGLALIPDEEFVGTQLRTAMEAGADGVFWWSGDRFYHSRHMLPDRITGPVGQYFDDLHRHVLSVLADTVEPAAGDH